MPGHCHRSLSLVFALTAPLAADALELRVNTFADEDDGQCTQAHCSLREAISTANATPGQTVILLGAGDYLLQKANPDPAGNWPVDEDANAIGDFDVHGQVSLVGRGATVTRLNANRLDRLFHVHAGAQLKLRSLGLTGGQQIYDGGALLNYGQVQLNQVELVDNRVFVYMPYPAAQAGNGGAIANFGILEVHRSTFRDNRNFGEEAQSAGKGGALYNEGTLTVRDSLFNANRASDYGEWGMGGGLYNQGSADIARTTFQANEVLRSGYGAAIANAGQLRLANSTLSGNRSIERGAFENGHPFLPQLSAQSRAELLHVTIAGNDGWGVTNRGDLLLRNSVVAGNRATEFDEVRNCQSLPGAVDFRARGLLLGTDGSNCLAENYIADAATFTHQLFPLQENNGAWVHPLRRTSAAIDAGVGNCSSHDQRGLDRQRDGNGDGLVNCDLGAFERAYP
ncbi:choice-of-anchor Q domain-containing protein [Pseudomonas solani]|uniref:choice-of-anchor Q domain-containing protein n=1 Tax=Pseudomonas solani TaxID=2731552 RepID=UPI003F4AD06E